MKSFRTSGSSHHGSGIRNLTGVHEEEGSIPGLSQWVKDPVVPQLQRRLKVQLGSAVAVAVAGSCSSNSTSSPGTSMCDRCGP